MVNDMNNKKLKFIGTIISLIIPFLLHFIYNFFPNFITSIFSPVNESIWEHMKILFGSIVLSGIVEKIIAIYKKEKINNLCFSNFAAGMICIPIFLIIFLPIYNIIGENLLITIIIMFISIIISKIISYKITLKENLKLEKITVLFVFIVYIIFTILTYYPLKNDLFIDPKTNKSGIK